MGCSCWTSYELRWVPVGGDSDYDVGRGLSNRGLPRPMPPILASIGHVLSLAVTVGMMTLLVGGFRGLSYPV